MGNIFLDLLFPSFCLGCKKQGTYLCEDCLACLDINNYHKPYRSYPLNDLYFALPYQNSLARKMICQFKDESFIKELSKPLASLIITHFQLINKELHNAVLVPIPLHVKRMKWRGFNQSEEIAKQLSLFWNIPLFNSLIKVIDNPRQTEIWLDKRKENVKGSFRLTNPYQLENKRILLIDDIYSTGSTIKEAALTVRQAKIDEVIGIVIARE